MAKKTLLPGKPGANPAREPSHTNTPDGLIVGRRPAKRKSKRFGNEPAATSPAASASHSGSDSPESRSDDMNMMTKIYASTAMSPVAMEAQDPAEHTITLPLVTPDVSPQLATLIESYVDALNSFLSRGDDQADQDFDDRGLMEQIAACPAKSYADLAAKMTLSLSELRRRPHMTADEVVIEDVFAFDLTAENLMLAVERDARTLAKGCNGDREINARFLADYSAWAEELQAYAAPGTDEEIEARSGAAADAVAHRIFDRPAMNVAELALKMRVLAGYYFPGSDEKPTEPNFEDTGSVIEPGHFAVVYQDVQNLAKVETGDAPPPRDTHCLAEEPKALPPILEWERALASYNALKDASDAMPLGTEGEDEAVDACCEAMDHLIEETPAPTIGAVLTKLQLALERSEGFEGLIEGHQNAILADLGRLSEQYDPLLAQPATPNGAHLQRNMTPSPTSIEVLQRLWDEANAAYEKHDEAEGKCGKDEEGRDARNFHREAAGRLVDEATLLSHSILRQCPVTWRDALHVACHAFNMVDLGSGMTEKDWTALTAGMDGLLVFIADEAEGNKPLAGWNGSMLRHVRSRVRARRCADVGEAA